MSQKSPDYVKGATATGNPYAVVGALVAGLAVRAIRGNQPREYRINDQRVSQREYIDRVSQSRPLYKFEVGKKMRAYARSISPMSSAQAGTVTPINRGATGSWSAPSGPSSRPVTPTGRADPNWLKKMPKGFLSRLKIASKVFPQLRAVGSMTAFVAAVQGLYWGGQKLFDYIVYGTKDTAGTLEEIKVTAKPIPKSKAELEFEEAARNPERWRFESTKNLPGYMRVPSEVLSPVVVTARPLPVPKPIPMWQSYLRLVAPLSPTLLPLLKPAAKERRTFPKSSKSPAQPALSEASFALQSQGFYRDSQAALMANPQLAPQTAKDCRCPKPRKKKRKPRSPRSVCYAGTYREGAKRLSKSKRRIIPCR